MFGKVIAQYKNGNYQVALMEDGTKMRFAEEPAGSPMVPEYPETIDMCITKKCSMGCKFCYENCTPTGDGMGFGFHSYAIWDDIPPYTELALNGNDMDLPGLSTFLEMLQRKKVIVNMTFSAQQYYVNQTRIKDYMGKRLINAIGISLADMNKDVIDLFTDSTLSTIPKPDKMVFHAILGLQSYDQLYAWGKKYWNATNKKANLLLLGYKTKGRGDLFYKLQSDQIKRNIEDVDYHMGALNDVYNVIAFDNLACEQLDMKSKMSPEEWNTLYMGSDGQFSMYIDAVNRTYSRNSCTPDSERHELKNTDSLKSIFQTIRKESSITDEAIKQPIVETDNSFQSSVLDNEPVPTEL